MFEHTLVITESLRNAVPRNKENILSLEPDILET